MTTSRDDIISNGTDGPGEASAGRRTSFGRANSDPADAETVSGSKGETPPVSQEAGGITTPPLDPSDPDFEPAVEPPVVDVVDAYVDAIAAEHDELSKLKAERDEYLDLARRTQADFENFRKRGAKDLADSRAKAVAGVVRELLPVVDSLDRALEAARAGTDAGALADGIKLVHNDLHGMLERLGLIAIEAVGERFDPTVHEAVASVPQEGVEPGVVIEVAQKGFKLDELIVRPARVVVSA